MALLDGYRVGGTIHVVVNNQVGFTTSTRDARSTFYATDVARMLQVPVFHVNGEDLEAVAQAVLLAVDFRQRFHSDAVIDIWCYRKHGHNEGDEPAFTQPVMVRAIQGKLGLRRAYAGGARRQGWSRRDDDAAARRHRRRLGGLRRVGGDGRPAWAPLPSLLPRGGGSGRGAGGGAPSRR
jgi:2-oxoglutarate dehydrogenase E1 component